jgi:hypothetical protein
MLSVPDFFENSMDPITALLRIGLKKLLYSGKFGTGKPCGMVWLSRLYSISTQNRICYEFRSIFSQPQCKRDP